MEDLKHRFLISTCVDGKKYAEIAKEIGVTQKVLSIWWEELKSERNEIAKIRNLYHRKGFKNTTFHEFYIWFLAQNRQCHYCHINQHEIEILFEKKLIMPTGRLTRGRSLELERKEPKESYDNLGNLVLCCYWCNNAKSDQFSDAEFIDIGKVIGEKLRKRLTDDNR
jgi:hypothetical protein